MFIKHRKEYSISFISVTAIKYPHSLHAVSLRQQYIRVQPHERFRRGDKLRASQPQECPVAIRRRRAYWGKDLLDFARNLAVWRLSSLKKQEPACRLWLCNVIRSIIWLLNWIFSILVVFNLGFSSCPNSHKRDYAKKTYGNYHTVNIKINVES